MTTALPKPEKRGPKPRKRIARRRRPNPQSKAARRRAWIKAVNLARKLARLRDGRCVMAGLYFGCGGVLQGAHIFGVGAYPAIALHEQNILGLCSGHHRWAHHHPIEWESFCREWIGDVAYDELRRLAVQTHEKPDPFAYLAERELDVM